MVLGEWLRLVHGQNSGILFGMLPAVGAPSSPSCRSVVTGAHRRLPPPTRAAGSSTTIALGLLLGGAIGNLLDRLRYGSVVDFVDMGIGTWRFYTYNVADAAITTAIVLLLAMAVFPRSSRTGAPMADGPVPGRRPRRRRDATRTARCRRRRATARRRASTTSRPEPPARRRSRPARGGSRSRRARSSGGPTGSLPTSRDFRGARPSSA